MEIINQHTKAIMEGCKERAREAGLKFDSESLEYIVTNRDMLELMPKGMIPTMYDYWVNDLKVIAQKREYELYPHNAYECVINSRPALSFYNDNNPDWLNVMIFYHVLGHIDFQQNNYYFRNTWNDDFVGQALADKRLIANLRSQHGRWVDYVIEFTRAVDNITGYYQELSLADKPSPKKIGKLDYFFDIFLQQEKKVKTPIYLKKIDLYNDLLDKLGDKNKIEKTFLFEIKDEYPEFDTLYKKHILKAVVKPVDVIEFIKHNSAFLKKEDNQWMKLVMDIVRKTALYFEPQFRDQIINEGWASYWHNRLFIEDDRIKGHEADYARINAFVTSLRTVDGGRINPYALGSRMFEFIADSASKGKFCYEFDKMKDREKRKKYNNPANKRDDYLFEIRQDFSDFRFVNTFVTQDFVDRYNLITVGAQLYMDNQYQIMKQYYIKSKTADSYKKLILGNLVHPPHITVSEDPEGTLVLLHHWEGKPLYTDMIDNVLIGLEYLWGNPVRLMTKVEEQGEFFEVVYTSVDRKVVCASVTKGAL